MSSSAFSLIKRTILHARAYWHLLGFFFILTLFATPIALLKPYAIKLLIDSGFGSEPVPAFISWFFPEDFEFTFQAIALVAASLVILVALIDNIYTYAHWVLETYVGERLVLNFRTLLFNHLQRLSLAYHDTKGSSDSLFRIQWDAMCIRLLLLGQLSPLVASSLTLVSMIAVMFVINWQFAVISLAIIPPLAFLTRLSTRRLKKDWYKVKDAESVAISVIHEVLSSLRVVKAFGQEENEIERFSTKAKTAVNGQVKMARMGGAFSVMVGMLLAGGTALFIYVGAHFVHSGKMTLGELTLVLAYLSQVIIPLQSIIKSLNEVQSSVASIDRVFSVFDEEKEVKERPDAVHLPRVKGAFAFQGVSFWYQKEAPILQEISFQINAGDRVGIIGSTGAGKSTLISLLNRFYDPSAGVVKVDGEDIRHYQLADYRNQFSMVLQEPVLFSTTIYENIKYGRPGATEEEVMEAAKAANAHEFISNGKDGYNTIVGERGMQLSGGERQRISIARAFIKNAPVLILDEPTSSLDVKTEGQIMEAMEKLMVGRTTFLITHRLDTLSSCNVILHLENGQLVDIVRDQDIPFLVEKKKALII